MDVYKLENIYSDYLLSATGQVTSTGLSSVVNNAISHDSFTHLLSSGQISSQSLLQLVKPMCHEIKSSEGVLIFNDSIVGFVQPTIYVV
jgi:deoxyhypusine synthase